MIKTFKIFFLLLFISIKVYADSSLKPAIITPFSISDIPDFAKYPPAVKNLITDAAVLTNQNLTYLYGSADPKNKGMDCSGTIYYLLTQNKVKDVPRSANNMYEWVKHNKTLYTVTSLDFNSKEL